MKRKSVHMLLVAVFVLGSVLPIYAAEKWSETIVLGSYPEASDSYPFNVALARIITQYTPTKCVVKGYAGSLPILHALKAGHAQIVAMNSYDPGLARMGKLPGLEEKQLEINLLAYLWPGTMAIAVRPNEGINRPEDLKGKTAMVVSPHMPIQEFHRYLLEYHGIMDQVRILRIPGIDGIKEGMINKTIDAYGYALGAAFSLEIQRAVGLQYIRFSHDAMAYAQKRVFGMIIDVQVLPHNLRLYNLPPNTDWKTWAYPYCLMASPHMPDHEVRGLLKAIYEHNDMLAEAFYRGHQTTLKNATELQAHFIPFHPAAVKFYKEAGVWSPQNEAKQKELLASK